MNRIAAYLNRYIDGVAYSAPSILDHYATDRSILKYHPRIVAVPANTQDLCRLSRFSFQLSKKKIELPITVRGAGNSKTGAAIGNGLVVSMENLSRIQEIDTRQRLIRVQAGATLGEVQGALRSHGLDLPICADKSETIGGIIARGAKGSLNSKFLDVSDMVEGIEFVLYDGTLIETQDVNLARLSSKQKPTEKEVYQKLAKLVKKQKPAAVSLDHRGLYGIPSANASKFNLAKLICGSEGSLGIISEVIMCCEAIYDAPDSVAIFCPSNAEFLDVAKILKSLNFTEIAFYDTEIFNAKESTGKDTSFFRKANDDGFLVIANAKDDSRRVRRTKLRKLAKKLPKNLKLICSNQDNISEFNSLDEKLTAYLNDSSSLRRLPLFDDVYVPVEKQGDYLEGINKLAAALKMPLALYGSLDHNLFTVRPAFNLDSSDDRRKMIKLIRVYFDLLSSIGASPCGNASDGRFVSIFANPKRDSGQLALEAEVKKIFDPANILNPGIKHEVDARIVLKHFRTSYNSGISSRD